MMAAAIPMDAESVNNLFAVAPQVADLDSKAREVMTIAGATIDEGLRDSGKANTEAGPRKTEIPDVTIGRIPRRPLPWNSRSEKHRDKWPSRL